MVAQSFASSEPRNPQVMTDLKRSVAGVPLYADTADPAKAERVKQAIDEAMRLLERERRTPPEMRGVIGALAGKR